MNTYTRIQVIKGIKTHGLIKTTLKGYTKKKIVQPNNFIYMITFV